MASVNSVTLIGFSGKPAELRYTASGNAVASFSLATSESFKDKNSGDWIEKTEWHNIVIFGKAAEFAGQKVAKGTYVYVLGKLQTRKWQDKAGVDRYTTEIVCEKLKLMAPKSSNGNTSSAADTGEVSGENWDSTDSIPF